MAPWGSTPEQERGPVGSSLGSPETVAGWERTAPAEGRVKGENGEAVRQDNPSKKRASEGEIRVLSCGQTTDIREGLCRPDTLERVARRAKMLVEGTGRGAGR